jgi:hypothetical protein
MAINRDIIAKWVPSLTPDVVAQKTVWTLNGAVVSEKLIGFRVSSRSFAKDVPSMRLQEGDKVTFSVCSVDEFGESTAIDANSEFLITPPEPPSNLVLSQKIKYRRIP